MNTNIILNLKWPFGRDEYAMLTFGSVALHEHQIIYISRAHTKDYTEEIKQFLGAIQFIQI